MRFNYKIYTIAPGLAPIDKPLPLFESPTPFASLFSACQMSKSKVEIFTLIAIKNKLSEHGFNKGWLLDMNLKRNAGKKPRQLS